MLLLIYCVCLHTLMGDSLVDPMAETITTLPSAGSSMISRAAPRMRSALAMHVPPNLCTTHCAPRGQPSSDVLPAGARSARIAVTVAPALRRRRVTARHVMLGVMAALRKPGRGSKGHGVGGLYRLHAGHIHKIWSQSKAI